MVGKQIQWAKLVQGIKKKSQAWSILIGLWSGCNRALSFQQLGKPLISLLARQTLSPRLRWGVSPLCQSADLLVVSATRSKCRCMCSCTCSLFLNQLSKEVKSEDLAFHGLRGGWYPSIHWKGVRWVAKWCREFCAYSAYGRNQAQSPWFSEQKVLRNRPIS